MVSNPQANAIKRDPYVYLCGVYRELWCHVYPYETIHDFVRSLKWNTSLADVSAHVKLVAHNNLCNGPAPHQITQQLHSRLKCVTII